MDSQYQKDKQFQKIQKKLLKTETTLQQLLQQECIIDMFRANHKGLHNYLKIRDFKQMITYVTIVGPSDDKMRSYKYPQVSVQILSSEIPKILEIMFSPSSQQQNSLTLFDLLMKYFEQTPNDTLSSYVIRIINPLYTYEPIKTQQALILSGQIFNISKFVCSRSLIVVQSETLLTVYFKQRKQLFLQIIGLYEKGEQQQIFMLQIVYILGQVMTKLWNDKHKQLGKMAQTIIKMIETVITKPKLFNQQALMELIMSNIVNFSDNSSHLIKMIINKAYKQLMSPTQQTIKTSNKNQVFKFGMKKFHLLKCLTLIITVCPKILEQMPNLHLFPYKLLELLTKHELNSMLHLQIFIILKELFKPCNFEFFKIILQKWNITETFKQIIRKQDSKSSQGWSGAFMNIVTMVSNQIKNNTQLGKYLKIKQPLIFQTCDNYIKPKQKIFNFNLAGYKANFNKSKPQYDQQNLLVSYKQFFEQSQILEQMQKITSIPSTVPQQMLDEIQNENIINSSWVLKPTQKV